MGTVNIGDGRGGSRKSMFQVRFDISFALDLVNRTVPLLTIQEFSGAVLRARINN